MTKQVCNWCKKKPSDRALDSWSLTLKESDTEVGKGRLLLCQKCSEEAGLRNGCRFFLTPRGFNRRCRRFLDSLKPGATDGS